MIVCFALFVQWNLLFIATLNLQQKHGLTKRARPWARVQLQFFEEVVLKREVIFHHAVSHQGVCHWGHLSSEWPVIGVISDQGGLSWGHF